MEWIVTIDRARRSGSTGPSLDDLIAAAKTAVRAGRLGVADHGPVVRRRLQEQGLRCTPGQARAVRLALLTDRQLAPSSPAGDPEPGSGTGPAPAVETLGTRVAAARKATGRTRAELADQVRCSPSMISLVESDRRVPGPELLRRIGDAVGCEAAWLRDGRTPEVTRRIADLLRFGERARAAHDLAELRRCVTELRAITERPLRRDEEDALVVLEVELTVHADDWAEVHRATTPLLARAARGEPVNAPVLPLCVLHLRSVFSVGAPGGDATPDIATMMRAYRLALSVLDLAAEEFRARSETRSNDWWRVAATTLLLIAGIQGTRAAVVQGTAWIAELREEGGAATSGLGSLLWNLATMEFLMGEREQALRKAEQARALIDAAAYPRDAVRVEVVFARLLIEACPERAVDAVELLRPLRQRLLDVGYPHEVIWWHAVMSRAMVVAGLPEEALRHGSFVVDRTAATGLGHQHEHLVMARLALGDAANLRGRDDEAREHYRAAEAVLDDGAATSMLREELAHCWAQLASRRQGLGDLQAALAASRRALRAVGALAAEAAPPPFPNPVDEPGPTDRG